MAEDAADRTAELAADVVARLVAARQTVATAESLTAGLCCATLTTVPGSSAAVRGGLIVYATDLKASLAGVPADVLAERGPVSEQTAIHLARGAAARTGSDWGVGLTGVAGPDPQDGHPVGEVWVAVASARHTGARRVHGTGDRASIRAQAVRGALSLLLERLGEH